MVCGSTSALILTMMRALPARLRVRGLALDHRLDRFMQVERRLQQPAQLRGARQAGQLQEDLVHVLRRCSSSQVNSP